MWITPGEEEYLHTHEARNGSVKPAVNFLSFFLLSIAQHRRQRTAQGQKSYKLHCADIYHGRRWLVVPKEVWQVARVVVRGRMGGHMRRGRVAMVVVMVVVAT